MATALWAPLLVCPASMPPLTMWLLGGGTAGLTLATRLAEQQAGSVAVVEAGTFYEIGNGNLSQVPATDAIYTGKAVDDWQSLIDWGYVTTPQAVSSFFSMTFGNRLTAC